MKRNGSLNMFQIILVLIFFFNVTILRFAWADHTGPNDLIVITNDLLAKCKIYMKAEAKGKTALMEKMKEVIDQRKEKLLEKIETDPSHVEAYLLLRDLG